jgi:hypothetical protein
LIFKGIFVDSKEDQSGKDNKTQENRNLKGTGRNERRDRTSPKKATDSVTLRQLYYPLNDPEDPPSTGRTIFLW